MSDKSEQNRDNDNSEPVSVKTGQALMARIMQDPQSGQLLVLLQLEGDDEHAWIADGRHFAGAIFNPPGVKIEPAVKLEEAPRVITPKGAGQIIKPN